MFTRAKQNLKTPYNGTQGKPTQLKFYPSQWADVLEEVKKKYRLAIVSGTPFPDCEMEMHFTTDCLVEAISDHEENGNMVEDGEFLLYRALVFTGLFKSRILPQVRKGNVHSGELSHMLLQAQ